MTNPVLFVGGTGVVGRQVVRLFSERHPDHPILIGGRDLTNAAILANEVGNASPTQVDTDSLHLGLSNDFPLRAIVLLTPDSGLKGMSLAQDQGIPYLSIGNWLVEVGAEMAHFIRRPKASPVVLASHWHGGIAVFLAQVATKNMEKVSSIHVGAIVDDLDATGPAAIADMERGAAGGSGVWAFEDGKRTWLSGEAASKTIKAIDGRRIKATAFSPYDIVSLQAASGAEEVRFDFASTISSSRLRGSEIATEIVMEIKGEANGKPVIRRPTIEFNKGQATLTGISTALSLSTVLGLEGEPPAPAGLFFPESLIDGDTYLKELSRYGAAVVTGIE